MFERFRRKKEPQKDAKEDEARKKSERIFADGVNILRTHGTLRSSSSVDVFTIGPLDLPDSPRDGVVLNGFFSKNPNSSSMVRFVVHPLTELYRGSRDMDTVYTLSGIIDELGNPISTYYSLGLTPEHWLDRMEDYLKIINDFYKTDK